MAATTNVRTLLGFLRALFLVHMASVLVCDAEAGVVLNDGPPSDFDLPCLEGAPLGFFSAKCVSQDELAPAAPVEATLAREISYYLAAPPALHGYPVFMYTTFVDGDRQPVGGLNCDCWNGHDCGDPVCADRPLNEQVLPGTQLGMGIVSYVKYYRLLQRRQTENTWSARTHPQPGAVLNLAVQMGQYLIHEALTPEQCEAGVLCVWPRYAMSTGNNTDWPLVFPSQGDLKYGVATIEPDKGAMAGYALALLYDVTGNDTFRAQALHTARVLATNQRGAGNETHSPWAFRVNARTGASVGGPDMERSSNVAFAMRLYDWVLHGGVGADTVLVEQVKRASGLLWSYVEDRMLEGPWDREHTHWVHFFEDHVDGGNRNSWAPMEVARYIIERRGTLAVRGGWSAAVDRLMGFALGEFGHYKMGGVRLLAEQDGDQNTWGGVASKLAGVAALYSCALREEGEMAASTAQARVARLAASWYSYFVDKDGCPSFDTRGPDTPVLQGPSQFRQQVTGPPSLPARGGWQEDAHTDKVHNIVDYITAVQDALC